MKKLIVFITLGILISITAFGSYFEISGSSFTMFELGTIICPIPSALPAFLAPQMGFVYGISTTKHLSVTADFEYYVNGCGFFNTAFASGAIGVRSTSDSLNTFLGPLRTFAGINGGMVFRLGTAACPMVTADAGVSFKLADNFRTFWDLKYYKAFSSSNDIHFSTPYFSNIFLLGGIRYTF